MSEKIYTRLLRLYPSSFRRRYEGEALQLIRDRFRDETGFLKRARLWWEIDVGRFGWTPTGVLELQCDDRSSVAFTECRGYSLLQGSG